MGFEDLMPVRVEFAPEDLEAKNADLHSIDPVLLDNCSQQTARGLQVVYHSRIGNHAPMVAARGKCIKANAAKSCKMTLWRNPRLRKKNKR